MQKLIKGIHRFQNEVFKSKVDLFKELEKGQNPQVLFITCSDSRINPNLLTQTDPGDLFIIRNAGNIIPPHGTEYSSVMAAVEFAIVGLNIKDIVVCGHSHCGAMKALLNPQLMENMPAMKMWLKNAEATKNVVFNYYKHLEGDARLMAAVEENVLIQLDNLKTHPVVAERIEAKELRLHAWVYKFETGMVFAYDSESGQFIPLAESLAYDTKGSAV